MNYAFGKHVEIRRCGLLQCVLLESVWMYWEKVRRISARIAHIRTKTLTYDLLATKEEFFPFYYNFRPVRDCSIAASRPVQCRTARDAQWRSQFALILCQSSQNPHIYLVTVFQTFSFCRWIQIICTATFARYLQQRTNLYSDSYKRVCSWTAATQRDRSLAFTPVLWESCWVAIRSGFHLTRQFCDKSLTHSWMLMEMNMMMWTEFLWLRMGSGGRLLWMRYWSFGLCKTQG